MFDLAFAYLFLWPLVLSILLIVVFVLLGPDVGTRVYWAVLVFGQFVIAPMFANAAYHWHVRRRIDKLSNTAPSHAALVERAIGQGSTANAAVVIGVVAVGGVSMTGILAAIAVPHIEQDNSPERCCSRSRRFAGICRNADPAK